MKSIYTCPYCGAKSFNPLKKAFTGGLHTKGKVCMECGQHCVNGKASMIFSAMCIIAALVLVCSFTSREIPPGTMRIWLARSWRRMCCAGFSMPFWSAGKAYPE